jgi:diguanylate cyclase (GGDEF)-like protein
MKDAGVGATSSPRRAATPTVVDTRSVAITVSIGVALCRPSDASAETVLARADEALYRARTRGRNRVEMPL